MAEKERSRPFQGLPRGSEAVKCPKCGGKTYRGMWFGFDRELLLEAEKCDPCQLVFDADDLEKAK